MSKSGEHSITIDRWRITYFAPDDETSPLQLRRRLDNLFRSEVAGHCDRFLHQALDPADPSVWRIRRLTLDLAADSNHSLEDGASSIWGSELAACIVRSIHRGDDADSVIWFPNRAAYLAQFARDLAAGRAWGKWFYQEFESLAGLPAGNAIREALTADTDVTALAILALMQLNGIQEVLRALTPADTRRIFQACRQNASAPSVHQGGWVGLLLQLWTETPLRTSGTVDPYRDAIWWLAIALSRHGGAECDAGLFDAIEGLLEIRRVFSVIRSMQTRDQIVRDLSAGRISSAVAQAIANGAATPESALSLLADSMQGDLHWVNEAIGVLLADEDYRRNATAARLITHGPSVAASFGGVFRLGPSFLATLPDSLATPLVLHLLAIKCLGGERAAASAEDAALKIFSGLDASCFETAIEEQGCSAPLDPDAAFRMLRSHLNAAGRCDGASWQTEVAQLPMPGGERRRVAVLCERLRDEWIAAAVLPDDAAESAAVMDRMATLSAEFGGDERGAGRRVPRPIEEDFAHFSLHEYLPQLDREFDLFLTVTARAILRHFARRLPAFASSSPEHLYRNFLAGDGFLRDRGDRIEVELPPVPLSLVLRIAGIHDEQYSLPWWKGRKVCILPLTD